MKKRPMTFPSGAAALALLAGAALAAVAPPRPASAQATTAPQQAPAPAARPADPAAPQAAPRAGAPAGDAAASPRAERRDDGRDSREAVVDASALEEGANSFTEGQARGRIEAAGFADVQELRKDDRGFWRARATRGGSPAEVAMDFRGRIAAGPGVAALDAGAGGAARGSTTSSPRPDGAPGNPPSTATGRAVDRMQGEAPRPDGAPGNPPGTAAGRAMDRATGGGATGADEARTPAPAGSGGPAR
jgi:hypothetical protein